MTLSWFGHSCFRLEGKNFTLLIDPFDKAIGLRPPRVKDDIILVTHQHHDHNSVGEVDGTPLLVVGPGEYEAKAVYIHGIQSFHDNSGGAERGLNTIYVIKAEEVTLCHLGDLGQEQLSEEQIDAIGEVDVLMIPVGGQYTIDHKTAASVVTQIEPKFIIPMHYQLPGLRLSKTIDGVDKFVKTVGLPVESTDKLKLSDKTLPAEEMKLVVFNI